LFDFLFFKKEIPPPVCFRRSSGLIPLMTGLFYIRMYVEMRNAIKVLLFTAILAAPAWAAPSAVAGETESKILKAAQLRNDAIDKSLGGDFNKGLSEIRESLKLNPDDPIASPCPAEAFCSGATSYIKQAAAGLNP